MDSRVLIGVGSIVAVVLVVGIVFALSTGDDNDVDENDVADTTPTEEVADVPEADDGVPEGDDEDVAPDEEADPTEENGEAVEEEPDDGAEEPEAAEEPQFDDMAYGFNVAWRADEEGQEFNQQAQDAIAGAGFNWVTFQVHWSEIQREPDWHDPAPVDRMVELYEDTDVNILISVTSAPEWALDHEGDQLLADWETFVGFMAFMADRYEGRVDAWEIWNEQNMAHEMHGTVRVSDYAYLLEAGYRGVKDADPEATVVFGGLTPTGINDPEVAVDDVDYLTAFYLYGQGHYAQFFDVMGMHLNATNNPPETSYPDNPGPGEWTDHNSFYFLRGQDLRDVMSSFDDEREVWVTEFGWTTENMAEGYEYGADVSEEDQANFLVGAFDVAREQMPWITGMFVWNLNFSTLVAPEDEMYPWSVLREDWSPRPAYEALQEMPKE